MQTGNKYACDLRLRRKLNNIQTSSNFGDNCAVVELCTKMLVPKLFTDATFWLEYLPPMTEKKGKERANF